MRNRIKIRLQNVWKKFSIERDFSFLKERIINELFKRKIKVEIWALRNVSFKLREGECLGVIGKNASGKTTLLKIIAGILRPTKGRVYTRGRIAPFLGLGSGFEDDLTGKENIYLQASLLGMKKRDIDKIYPTIVEFSELFDFTDVKLKDYSEGMKARLGFSIMVNVDADVLLIDDILAVGDSHFQKKCNEKIEELKSLGKTVIFVSHNMEAVRRYCDVALYLHRGEVMDFGPAEKVTEEYERHLASGFVEYPTLVDRIDERNELSISKILKESSRFGIKNIVIPKRIGRGPFNLLVEFEPNLGKKMVFTLNNHIHTFQIIGIPVNDKVSVMIDSSWLMKGDYMVTLTLKEEEKNINIPYPIYFRVER